MIVHTKHLTVEIKDRTLAVIPNQFVVNCDASIVPVKKKGKHIGDTIVLTWVPRVR